MDLKNNRDEIKRIVRAFEDESGSGRSDEKHDSYVYALIDPRDNRPFYIGKGTGARMWQHDLEAEIKEAKAEAAASGGDVQTIRDELTRKHKRINEIEKAGREVVNVIVKWGLTDDEAFMAESALINLLKFENRDGFLTNIANGHASDKEQASRLGTTQAMTDGEFLKECAVDSIAIDNLKIPVVFTRIDKTFDPHSDDPVKNSMYDCARFCWKLKLESVKKAQYALALSNDVVKAAYHVNSGSWFSVNDPDASSRFPWAPSDDDKRNDRVFYEKCDDELPDEIKDLIGKAICFESDPELVKSQNFHFNYRLTRKSSKVVFPTFEERKAHAEENRKRREEKKQDKKKDE